MPTCRHAVRPRTSARRAMLPSTANAPIRKVGAGREGVSAQRCAALLWMWHGPGQPLEAFDPAMLSHDTTGARRRATQRSRMTISASSPDSPACDRRAEAGLRRATSGNAIVAFVWPRPAESTYSLRSARAPPTPSSENHLDDAAVGPAGAARVVVGRLSRLARARLAVRQLPGDSKHAAAREAVPEERRVEVGQRFAPLEIEQRIVPSHQRLPTRKGVARVADLAEHVVPPEAARVGVGDASKARVVCAARLSDGERRALRAEVERAREGRGLGAQLCPCGEATPRFSHALGRRSLRFEIIGPTHLPVLEAASKLLTRIVPRLDVSEAAADDLGRLGLQQLVAHGHRRGAALVSVRIPLVQWVPIHSVSMLDTSGASSSGRAPSCQIDCSARLRLATSDAYCFASSLAASPRGPPISLPYAIPKGLRPARADSPRTLVRCAHLARSAHDVSGTRFTLASSKRVDVEDEAAKRRLAQSKERGVALPRKAAARVAQGQAAVPGQVLARLRLLAGDVCVSDLVCE
eukprot:2935540-Prymnesium_polylepis.2